MYIYTNIPRAIFSFNILCFMTVSCGCGWSVRVRVCQFNLPFRKCDYESRSELTFSQRLVGTCTLCVDSTDPFSKVVDSTDPFSKLVHTGRALGAVGSGPAAVLAAVRTVGRGFGRRVVVRVCRWVWMVVRFVCVIRVPVCARVSRVCPGSPRCLFTVQYLPGASYRTTANSAGGDVQSWQRSRSLSSRWPISWVRPAARTAHVHPRARWGSTDSTTTSCPARSSLSGTRCRNAATGQS